MNEANTILRELIREGKLPNAMTTPKTPEQPGPAPVRVQPMVLRRHRVEDRSSPCSMGLQRRIASDTHTGPWVERGTTAAAWKAYKKSRRQALASKEAQGSLAVPSGYEAFYDHQARRIYIRIPKRDELGEPGHCDHGIDHAMALRLRDQLNNALLMRPHNDQALPRAGRK